MCFHAREDHVSKESNRKAPKSIDTYNKIVLRRMKLTKVGGVWIANQQLEQRGDNDDDDIDLIQMTLPTDAWIDNEVPDRMNTDSFDFAHRHGA